MGKTAILVEQADDGTYTGQLVKITHGRTRINTVREVPAARGCKSPHVAIEAVELLAALVIMQQLTDLLDG